MIRHGWLWNRISGTIKVGKSRKRKRWTQYRCVMRREEHCVGRGGGAMGSQVKDDIREKGLSGKEVYDRAT